MIPPGKLPLALVDTNTFLVIFDRDSNMLDVAFFVFTETFATTRNN
jgi:hypothetical protein